jgi:hypothetical protein
LKASGYRSGFHRPPGTAKTLPISSDIGLRDLFVGLLGAAKEVRGFGIEDIAECRSILQIYVGFRATI